MSIRLLILVPFTLIAFLISCLWLFYGEGFPWFFGMCTLVGTFGIVQIIASHRQFKLVDNTLVLKSFLKNARPIDLSTMAEWRELGFNIRGQRRMTIILFFRKEEKVVVDNSHYKAEFDELLTYLSQNHARQKQVSI